MSHKIALFATVILVAGVLSGCATKPKASNDFLSDYANLQKVNDDFSFYKARDMTKANYPKLIVEPIQFQRNPEAAKGFTEEEKLKIQEYTRKAQKKIISAHYQIVNEPGPDVDRLRMAFTDIEKSNALLALYPARRAAGVGRGDAAVEGEVLDSETG